MNNHKGLILTANTPLTTQPWNGFSDAAEALLAAAPRFCSPVFNSLMNPIINCRLLKRENFLLQSNLCKTATLKKTENSFLRPKDQRSKIIQNAPSLSYHLSLRSLFCLFLSGSFTQVLLYMT